MSSTFAPDAQTADSRVRGAKGSAFAIGIVVSVIVHATLIGVGVFRFEFSRIAEPDQPIPVQLVPDPNPPQEKKPAPAPTVRPEAEPPEAMPEATIVPPPSAAATTAAPNAKAAELDALRADIERCWTVPSGWTDPKQVTVVVDFAMTVEGAVTARPTVIEFSANQYGATAAKNAIDAVLKCGPYRLPPASYKDWQHVQIRLTPPG